MERKKKLVISQISLLIIGILIILFTYTYKDGSIENTIITKEKEEAVKSQDSKKFSEGDFFFNIEYSGLDLSGNRYILKSKEAYNNKTNLDVVNMKFVEATFYFKNNTILNVWSNEGIYNNKTLDMTFFGDVKGLYENSSLFSEKAEYSNSKGFLTITENVKIIDYRGTMVADRLSFDIKKQTLDIASFSDNKINANVNLK
jgi:lipopolysaccharide assembly outer membrane protein LptD (OstA)